MPLAVSLLAEAPEPILDLGCGAGQLMEALGGCAVVGCDLVGGFLRVAARFGPVVRCRLPDLSWLRPGAFGSAACVFVVEHLPEAGPFFAQVSRVVRAGGTFVLVMNHPAYTPDGAGPVVDLSDGEVMWRWGDYFEEGSGLEPAGEGTVRFFHRSLGRLLSEAAAEGFDLQELVEVPLSPRAVARDPVLAGQEHFPRVLGARWRRRSRP